MLSTVICTYYTTDIGVLLEKRVNLIKEKIVAVKSPRSMFVNHVCEHVMTCQLLHRL